MKIFLSLCCVMLAMVKSFLRMRTYEITRCLNRCHVFERRHHIPRV